MNVLFLSCQPRLTASGDGSPNLTNGLQENADARCAVITTTLVVGCAHPAKPSPCGESLQSFSFGRSAETDEPWRPTRLTAGAMSFQPLRTPNDSGLFAPTHAEDCRVCAGPVCPFERQPDYIYEGCLSITSAARLKLRFPRRSEGFGHLCVQPVTVVRHRSAKIVGGQRTLEFETGIHCSSSDAFLSNRFATAVADWRAIRRAEDP